MFSKPTRRDFLTITAASIAASQGAVAMARDAAQESGEENHSSSGPKIGVFTKPLNSISFDMLADRLADAGFDGIEATVRKGGNVEPESVEQNLPRLVESLARRGLTVMVLTSDINDASDPLSERVLRTAATLGITKYRMQYFKYDLDRPILSQIESWRPQLRELAAMNHEFGVQGLYQNHAGERYFGSAIWDLNVALDGIDPRRSVLRMISATRSPKRACRGL